MMSIEGRLLLVVVAFAEEEPSFVLLLLAKATTVLVPGVTGCLSKGGDAKSAFVLFIFHCTRIYFLFFFDTIIYEK